MTRYEDRRFARPAIWTALAVFVVGIFTSAAAFAGEDDTQVLRVASLAPGKSSWGKALERISREVQKKTDGQVEIKLYPNGVMGDEPAIVEKMDSGQLDGAALTNTGLGEIEKKVLVLQLPMVFQNWEEVDHVRNKMSDTFKKLLADQGFTLLSWGDVGFSYIFSNSPVRTPSDIQSTKLWVWESDPIMQAVAEVANVNAVPLAVTDVLPSLKTGVVNAFTNSPYGAVSLQWFNQAKYVTNLKLSVIVGGIVMRSESLEELSEEHRKIVREVADKHGQKLLSQIREDNKESISTIREAGAEVVQPEKLEEWQTIAKKAREKLAGEVFPESLVDEMMKHLEEYR